MEPKIVIVFTPFGEFIGELDGNYLRSPAQIVPPPPSAPGKSSTAQQGPVVSFLPVKYLDLGQSRLANVLIGEADEKLTALYRQAKAKVSGIETPSTEDVMRLQTTRDGINIETLKKRFR